MAVYKRREMPKHYRASGIRCERVRFEGEEGAMHVVKACTDRMLKHQKTTAGEIARKQRVILPLTRSHPARLRIPTCSCPGLRH